MNQSDSDEQTSNPVESHYDQNIYEFERERLDDEHRIEYEITLRYLEQYVPDGASVVDIGVGGGQYARFLAEQGCKMTLVDLSSKLLQSAVHHLEEEGLGNQIVETLHTSATDLSNLKNERYDVVLGLGPFYHLTESTERKRARAEMKQLLKPEGILFASAINRTAFLRDAFRDPDTPIVERKNFYMDFIRKGTSTPETSAPLGHAYLTTPDEFRDFLTSQFHQKELVELESFASADPQAYKQLTEEQFNDWLDVIERTGRTKPGLFVSNHILFVGKKR